MPNNRPRTDQLRDEIRAAQTGRRICPDCGMWWRNDLGHPHCPPTTEDAIRDRTAPRRAPRLDVDETETVTLMNGRGEVVVVDEHPAGYSLHHPDDTDLGKGRARCHVCQHRYFIALGHTDCTNGFRPPLAPVPEYANPADAITDADRAYLESLDYTHAAGPAPARRGRPSDLRSLMVWIDEHGPAAWLCAFIVVVWLLVFLGITAASWIGGIAA